MGRAIQRLAADAKGRRVKGWEYSQEYSFFNTRDRWVELREAGLSGFLQARVNIYVQNFGFGVGCGFLCSVRAKIYKENVGRKVKNMGFWAKEEVTS